MDRRARLSCQQTVDSPSDMSLHGWRPVIGTDWVAPSSATAFNKSADARTFDDLLMCRSDGFLTFSKSADQQIHKFS